MPDHPGILQLYVWQDLDLDPDFPVLTKFLNFWKEQIEGPLHSVEVGAVSLLTAGEMRNVDHMLVH